VRSTILSALLETAPQLSGTLLDVGCGYMPYKSLVFKPPSSVTKYVGLDMESTIYTAKPDLLWDGRRIPLSENAVDCALATEVFEHCPNPEIVMHEAVRVLKPNGLLFFTVPFLWPLHDVPYDQYRYTPFALERHLKNAGFVQITMRALGGWDASLAQMIGLWVRRRPMSVRKRAILSQFAAPLVRYLSHHDRRPAKFHESSMITGLVGTARKPAA
jgi:SAM-dependent methyltransferase